jgi:hypothetical protein
MFAMLSYHHISTCIQALFHSCALQNSVVGSWMDFKVPFSVMKLQNYDELPFF